MPRRDEDGRLLPGMTPTQRESWVRRQSIAASLRAAWENVDYARTQAIRFGHNQRSQVRFEAYLDREIVKLRKQLERCIAVVQVMQIGAEFNLGERADHIRDGKREAAIQRHVEDLMHEMGMGEQD